MAVLMYNRMFNWRKYLSQWILNVYKDGLQNKYNINPNATGGHSCISSSSYNLRNNMLHSSAGGKVDNKELLQMTNESYQSKEANYRLSSQNNFPRPPESPLYDRYVLVVLCGFVH
ncbi:hypothetical protein BX661DRAFT_168761 [Kickxella alabastrina]|uniref:uncharacterized protein n=1 Tax=Kickxella alabastrina TaxID=61397 RepID=UPI0022203BA3|nr:uncharacterized protein BX661DRAFT_168761 [Kickxella alabastrina]KAI7833612.1 hypothetical protein BX661DRAFT_168761 [Kickxella alabastrina]